jgi:hypothetical protein
MASIRCKLTGCDLDPCGICKRCKDQSAADHAWEEAERDRPCYKRLTCANCDEVKESPVHDWTPKPVDAADGSGVELRCSRCNLKI